MVMNEKLIWKLIPLSGIAVTAVFLVADIMLNANGGFSARAPLTFESVIAVDSVTILAFFALAFLSPNYRVYAGICVAHGVLNVISGSEMLGFSLYVLGAAFLFRAGWFRQGSKVKIAILATVLFGSLLAGLFKDPVAFIKTVVSIGTLSLVFAILLFLFYPYLTSLLPEAGQKPVLRLSDLGFKERDRDFLRRVSLNEKYDAIAAAYHISESTVKQRMLVLYRKLEVENRSEFMVLASNRDIRYGPREGED